MSAPLCRSASTTTVPSVMPAMIRLRMAKDCLSPLRLKGNCVMTAPDSAMRPNNAARAAAHDRHADIGQLIGQFARGLDAVMCRHPRTDHRHGIFVLRGQRAFDVKHQRRVVDLPERFGIILVALN